MVPGGLLSTSGLRLPPPPAAEAWCSASPLDNVNSLANYITGLQSTLTSNLPPLTDTPEGAHSSLCISIGFGNFYAKNNKNIP